MYATTAPEKKGKIREKKPIRVYDIRQHQSLPQWLLEILSAHSGTTRIEFPASGRFTDFAK